MGFCKPESRCGELGTTALFHQKIATTRSCDPSPAPTISGKIEKTFYFFISYI